MTAFRSYSEVQGYLEGLDPFRIKLGLGPTRRALERLGSPHDRLKVFHVAGTNGKGSTCALLSSMLRAAGYRVGLYTSPHFLDVRERIRIDGEMISRPAFARAADQVRSALRKRAPFELTHFEFLTVAAFKHFDSEGVDFAVVETGMGGRLDATNTVRPCVSIITPIGLDHAEWLGDTLDAVAAEKAMIIKPGVPAVVAEPRGPFRRRAAECGVPLIVPREGSDWRRHDGWSYPERQGWQRRVRQRGASSLVYRGRRYRIPFEGRSFASNAALALSALEAADIHLPWAAIHRGLSRCRWPGRGEWVRWEGRPWLLDVAHNPHAMGSLKETFRSRFPRTAPTVVLSLLRTKDASGVLAALAPWVGTVVLTRAADPKRTHDPIELLSIAARLGMSATIEEKPARAFDAATRMAPTQDPVIASGSHTLIAHAYRHFRIPVPNVIVPNVI